MMRAQTRVGRRLKSTNQFSREWSYSRENPTTVGKASGFASQGATLSADSGSTRTDDDDEPPQLTRSDSQTSLASRPSQTQSSPLKAPITAPITNPPVPVNHGSILPMNMVDRRASTGSRSSTLQEQNTGIAGAVVNPSTQVWHPPTQNYTKPSVVAQTRRYEQSGTSSTASLPPTTPNQSTLVNPQAQSANLGRSNTLSKPNPQVKSPVYTTTSGRSSAQPFYSSDNSSPNQTQPTPLHDQVISLLEAVNRNPIQPMDTEFILVMGPTGAGKTSFINAVSNSSLKVGHGLQSCTSEVNFSEPFTVNSRQIVLFDTPGFDDTNRSDTDILTEIALFLTKFYEKKSKLIGVIYLHDITQFRMGGSAVRNVKMFNTAIGESAANNVVVLTTKWDLLPTREIGEEREKQLKEHPDFFQSIVSAGATIRRFLKGDNPMSIIENIITGQRTNLRLVDEMMQGKKLKETDAGKILNKDVEEAVEEAKKVYQEQMDKMRDTSQAQLDEMRSLLKDGHEKKLKLLEEKRDGLDRNLNDLQHTPIGKRVNDLLGAMWLKLKGLKNYFVHNTM